MDEPVEPDGPLLTFYRFIEEARLPQRADRSAGGSIPTRGFRYCEPVTTASAFGSLVLGFVAFRLLVAKAFPDTMHDQRRRTGRRHQTPQFAA